MGLSPMAPRHPARATNPAEQFDWEHDASTGFGLFVILGSSS